jgi:hypothetical protein
VEAFQLRLIVLLSGEVAVSPVGTVGFVERLTSVAGLLEPVLEELVAITVKS